MGVSTDGELAFGIDFGEDNPLLERDEDGDLIEGDEDEDSSDLADFLARKTGLVSPYLKLPHEVNHGPYDAYDDWKKENPWFEAEANEYFEAKRKLADACPLEIHLHCSYDYPMFILAIKGTHLSASRGSPQKVNFARLNSLVTEDKLAEARKFCEEYGLPEFYGADWLLFSMWG